MTNTQIYPIHSSLRKRGYRRKPKDMNSIKIDADTREEITNVALSIFAESINVGTPFQDALLSIYLSGMHHGYSVAQENKSPEPGEE